MSAATRQHDVPRNPSRRQLRRRLRNVAAVAAMAIATSAAAGSAREWRFDVSLDGRPIGEHLYTLREHEEVRELTSQANFRVKVLFFPAYRYEHQAREVWRGECLERLDASTNDNGERSTVVGRQTRGEFRVQARASLEVVQPCVQSFAYWNPRILDAAQLLNPQTGEYVRVTVERTGRDSIGSHGDADRYRLTGTDASGDPLQIDLWYTPEREWLALESRMPDGRRLRYSLK